MNDHKKSQTCDSDLKRINAYIFKKFNEPRAVNLHCMILIKREIIPQVSNLNEKAKNKHIYFIFK